MNFRLGTYQVLGHNPLRNHHAVDDKPAAKSEPIEGDSPAKNDVVLGFFKVRRAETRLESKLRIEAKALALRARHAAWDSWEQAASGDEKRGEAVARMKACTGLLLELNGLKLTDLPPELPRASVLDISENKLKHLPSDLVQTGYTAMMVMQNPELSKGWWGNLPAKLETLVVSEGQLDDRKSKFPGLCIMVGKSWGNLEPNSRHPLSWDPEDDIHF